MILNTSKAKTTFITDTLFNKFTNGIIKEIYNNFFKSAFYKMFRGHLQNVQYELSLIPKLFLI